MSHISIHTANERILSIQFNDHFLFVKKEVSQAEVKTLKFEEQESKEIVRFLTESIENKHLTEIEFANNEKDIYFTSANMNGVYTFAIAVYSGNEMESFYDSDTELTDFFKFELVHSGDEMRAFKSALNSLVDSE